jgi:hypothetical protein
MLNSITNAMHAIALAVYTVLVYLGLERGDPDFTWLIFLSFLCVFLLKVLGMIVHLPWIDKVRPRHNLLWIMISVVVVILNACTLAALGVSAVFFWTGIVWTAVLCGLYVKSLFGETWGNFGYVALAMAGIYGLCGALSRAELRIAWFLLLASNVLWMLLVKIDFLRRYKFHNDIYHLALIGSSYYLYSTIDLGLWRS